MTSTEPENASPHTRRARAAKRPLSRESILEAALELLGAGGAKALTMRRLGRALGVEAMSLYHYLENRDDLLDGVVEALVREIVEAALSGHRDEADWKETAKRFMNAYRAVGQRRPDAYRLFAQRPLRTEAAKELGKQLTDSFIACGLDFNDAVIAYRALTAFVGGFVLLETSGMRPAYTIGDMDAEFEGSIDVIIAGVEQRIVSAARERNARP